MRLPKHPASRRIYANSCPDLNPHREWRRPGRPWKSPRCTSATDKDPYESRPRKERNRNRSADLRCRLRNSKCGPTCAVIEVPQISSTYTNESSPSKRSAHLFNPDFSSLVQVNCPLCRLHPNIAQVGNANGNDTVNGVELYRS